MCTPKNPDDWPRPPQPNLSLDALYRELACPPPPLDHSCFPEETPTSLSGIAVAPILEAASKRVRAEGGRP